jgi:ketose-bisphosphate aldolase
MYKESSMAFFPLKDLVDRAFRNGYAVPSFCAWSAESIEIILSTAERMHAPVIVMHGPSELIQLRPAVMAAVARSIESLHRVTAALHLDHGDTLDIMRQCLEARYTGVMLDWSARPFDENTAGLRETVRMAKPLGITVEGELGHVGKADNAAAEGSGASVLTDPAIAARYVRETGVDLLAVSVGNKHGFYRGEPRLEFELLERLHAAVPVPLVMHGGTGIPERDIQRSINLGIAKVNVASEFVHAFRASLTSQWGKGVNLWAPIAVAETRTVIEPVIEKWIRVTGAEGKA